MTYAGVPGTYIAQTWKSLVRSTDHGGTWIVVLPEVNYFSYLTSANGVFYASGADCSTIQRSSDAGATWNSIGTVEPGCIDAMTVTSGVVPRILVNTTDSSLLASDDGGASFQPVGSGLPAGFIIGTLRASDITPGLVLATVANQFPATGSSIYRSIDAGNTWTLAYEYLWSPYASISFGANGTVYLAAQLVVTSIDNGESWYQPSFSLFGATYVKAHRTQPGRVYFGYQNGTMKESFDGGASSTELGSGNIMANTLDPASVTGVAFDDLNPGTDLVASTGAIGIYRRTGNDWSQANAGLESTPIRALAAHPLTPTRVLAGIADVQGASRGIYRSDNAGATWTSQTSGLRASGIRSITMDPTTFAVPESTIVYAGGSAPRTPTGYSSAGIWKSVDGGSSWSAIDAGLPVSGSTSIQFVRSIVLDPRSCANPPAPPAPCTTGPLSTLYATSNGITPNGWPTVYRVMKSTNAGTSWTNVDGLPQRIVTSDTDQSVVPLEIVINPHNPQQLFVGTFADITAPVATIANGVFRSDDGGASWQLASTGLPLRAGSTVSHLDVYGLAIDPDTPSTLWAAVSESDLFGQGIPESQAIYKSTDAGANWVLSSNGMTGGLIRAFAVDPSDSATLYAAAFGSPANPAGAYRSRDGGATWRSISVGLDGDGLLAIEVDPSNPSRLYAGTHTGVATLEQALDTDEDGVPDAIELAGPNNGDGNNDGTQDAFQANVAGIDLADSSQRWAGDGATTGAASSGRVTIAIDADVPGTCEQLVDAQSVATDRRPSDGSGVNRLTHRLPNLRFEILDCPAATVTAIFHEETFDATDRLRFYGSSAPGLNDLGWRDLNAGAATINGQTLTIRLERGELGSYRHASSGAILFEGGIGSERIFSDDFD